MSKFLPILKRNSVHVASERAQFDRRVAALRVATGKPERFVVQCACAVYDAGFSVLFERFGSHERFRIAAIEKDGAAGASGGVPRRRSIRVEEIDDAGWKCPHCGNAGDYVHCGGCNTIICGSSVRSVPGTKVFNCRASCGRTGSLVPLEEVSGHDATASGAHRRAAPKARGARLLREAPPPDLPQLGKPHR